MTSSTPRIHTDCRLRHPLEQRLTGVLVDDRGLAPVQVGP